MSTRYVVVRRWRSGSATLSLHVTTCRSVRRAEMATFIVARSPLEASVKASTMFHPEVTVGRSHWGAECACCDALDAAEASVKDSVPADKKGPR